MVIQKMNAKEMVEIYRVPLDSDWFPDVDEEDKESREAIVSIDHVDETITYCSVKKGGQPNPDLDDEAFPFDDFKTAVEAIRKRSFGVDEE